MRILLACALLVAGLCACNPAPERVTIQVFFQLTDAFAVGSEPYERPVSRTVSATDDLPVLVLEQLFIGPTAAEQEQGLALITSGTTGFTDFRVEEGVAHLSLQGDCSSGGSTYTIANLIFANLAQFPEIQWVKIYDQKGSTGTPEGRSSSIPFCLEP